MELDVYKEWLGIPDGPRPPDHYTLLRLVRFEDEEDKVRKNYRKLNAHVRKYASGQYSVRSQELLNELAKSMLCLTDPDRKREYDESLGRVFEEDPNATVEMHRLLVKQGHVPREKLKEIEEYADQRGLSLRDAVVQMKLVSADIATQAYAQELRLPFVDLQDLTPDAAVLDQVPAMLCKRNTLLPLFLDENRLLVACSDELSQEVEDELRLRFSASIRRVLATPASIKAAIAEYYAPGLRDDAGKRAAPAKAGPGEKAKTNGGGSEAIPKAAASGPRLAFTQLPADEQARRKQMGQLMMMWSVIGSIMLGFLILQFMPGLHKTVLTHLPYILALLTAPPTVLYVTKFYWK